MSAPANGSTSGPDGSGVDQVRKNLANDPYHYWQREDWGDTGPGSTFGAVDLLLNRVGELEQAIRTHRDARGDDRCWWDDEALYQVLPEGYTPPSRSESVELEACKRYIACRHHPGTVYVSPQERIRELEGELHFWLKRVRLSDLSDNELAQFRAIADSVAGK